VEPAKAENWSDDPEPGAEGSSNESLARLLVADGKAVDRTQARAKITSMQASEIAAYLRGQSSEQLLGVYLRKDGPGYIDIPKVFADGYVLPRRDSLQLFAAGDYNRVPTILGTNRDENKLFLYASPIFVRQWFDFFPQVRDWNLFEASAEYMSKAWKASAADGLATAMRKAQGASVYVYRFDWDEEPRDVLFFFDLARLFGAAHGFEIPFVFGHWQLGPSSDWFFTADNEPGRLALSREMMSYWAQFARTGSPNRGRDGTLTQWPAWEPGPEVHKALILDTPEAGGSHTGSETVTIDAVLAQIESDPRLASAREKCFVYRQIALWNEKRGFGKDEYPEAGAQGCGGWPFESWPW
jgi:para-nitrobenzyl esterase